MTRAHVFAVDESAVQLVRAGTVVDIAIEDSAAERLDVPSIPSPPGGEVSRFATISDLHIGESGFGIAPRVREARGRHDESFTVRAARAAIAEAVEWGARHIVVKGDITWSARPAQWERAAEVLAASPVPVTAVVGNHDVSRRGQDGRPWLEDAGIELVVDEQNGAEAVDLDGVRLVLAHTPTFHPRGKGAVPRETRQRIVELLGAAPHAGGTVLIVHHYFDRFASPTRYPLGVAHDDAVALFDAIAATPPTLVTTGHSHRHRKYRRGGITVSEVGSTKDYPGVWAGYVVHEGGLRQVVRRIAEPSVVEWTDRTRHTCLGMWGYWTPGRLDWRCFSLPWLTAPER